MRRISRGIPVFAALAAALALPLQGAAQEQPRAARGERVQPPVQSRGWFGFSFSPVAENGGRGQWVAVRQVEPNSGAARGGLQQGDTIVRWANRTDVTTALQEGRFAPEESVRLRARRNGRERDLTLVAGTRPQSVVRRSEDGRVIVVDPSGLERRVRIFTDSTLPRFDSLGIHADSLHRRLRVMLRDSLGPQLRELERLPGMRFEIHRDSILGRAMLFDLESGLRGVAGAEFTDLNPDLAAYFSADRGVLVLRVAPDTPAARAGLQAGDVVRRVNGRNVERVADLRAAINRASNRTVELDVVRRGNARNVRMSWD
jgi:S1-C subfamily serine protease